MARGAPIFDIVDKGEEIRTNLRLKFPVWGIDKDKVNVKATKDYIEISSEQSERRSGHKIKGKKYV